MDRVRATIILWSSVGALTSDVRPQTNAHNVKEPQELKKRIDSVELFCTVRERWGCAPTRHFVRSGGRHNTACFTGIKKLHF